MLAALLCNLGGTPVPPPAPPPAAQPFFGGGPFKKRYGYDPRYYYDEELPEDKAEIVHSAIEKAVEAIRTVERPKPVVLDAKRLYERVYRDSRIEQERITQMWRAEVKRRLQEIEDEEMIVCLMCL